MPKPNTDKFLKDSRVSFYGDEVAPNPRHGGPSSTRSFGEFIAKGLFLGVCATFIVAAIPEDPFPTPSDQGDSFLVRMMAGSFGYAVITESADNAITMQAAPAPKVTQDDAPGDDPQKPVQVRELAPVHVRELDEVKLRELEEVHPAPLDESFRPFGH